MSRNRRGWEDWEPEYRRFYSDEHGRRRYTPAPAPTAEGLPRSSFNHWRDGLAAPTSYSPQRSHGRGNHNERWRDDSRSRQPEPSHSRRRRDFGPSRDRDDREQRRDRDPSRQNPSRQRYSTFTPPYPPQPITRVKPPTESAPLMPKPAPPEPPRKASLPASKPPKALKPSPAYLSLSQEPSTVLRDPAISRKLLVLDLNGTLLVRSARSRAASGPQLRAVQPRPYMQSFGQYLFCLETKAWLDTMVWSSAQPHSVDDMVDKVFGTTKGELRAVWSRKSLGLSELDYHRKTVAPKDLTKPWELFASALSPEKPKGYSSASQSQVTHSAFTTLLLDDSPHKAVLQPYNHVCIPEYDSARRQRDLQSFLAPKALKQHKKEKGKKNQVEKAVHSTDQTMPELLPRGGLTGSAEQEPYDVVLLAVIGILETLKSQSNVASWVRKGGLWATQERGEEGGVSDVKHCNTPETEGGKTRSNGVVRTGKGASSASSPTLTSVQAHPQTKMWFDDPSVVAFWVERGRKALVELGIQIVHGVMG